MRTGILYYTGSLIFGFMMLANDTDHSSGQTSMFSESWLNEYLFIYYISISFDEIP